MMPMATSAAATKVSLKNLPLITNPIYYPLYKDTSRYLVLYGGAGSGKSVFAAQKVLFRVLKPKERHKYLVIRKVARTLRHSVFDQIKDTITAWGFSELFKINKTDMEITCFNGNSIIFAGLDDVEKLKSIQGVTDIWIEEASEVTQQDFQQLDLRLRGKTDSYKQIIITFNPVNILHWLKVEFFDKQRPNVTVLKTTYLDNIFIDDEYRDVLTALKGSDPYYYTVYCLGEWGVVGSTVFDAQKVTERLLELKAKQKYFVQGNIKAKTTEEGDPIPGTQEFQLDPNGFLKIYEMPLAGYPYVIGGDIAEGGYDWSVGQVLKNTDGRQVATWRAHTDTDLYAKEMFNLGYFYNKALIAIETNFDLHPVKELARLKYPRQYLREYIDKITKKREDKYGFQTTKASRGPIIGDLVAFVRDNTELINDLTTLEEMLTFVRNEDGRPEAQESHHDDCILALAIAHKAREQHTIKVNLPEPEKNDIQRDKEKIAKNLKGPRQRRRIV
jgi:phage terminase large subunit